MREIGSLMASESCEETNLTATRLRLRVCLVLPPSHTPRWFTLSFDAHMSSLPNTSCKSNPSYLCAHSPQTGASKLWAGTVTIKPEAKTGAHHHGELESVIYIVKGRARMRWGDRLQFTAEASAGDFIFVPPFVPHQEMNASNEEPLECVLVRSGQEAVVVNLDIPFVEPNPEHVVKWLDDIHH
eukprot:TRINITY_DN2386_c0_g1_i1.p1 TRINITY_DN2386_c0_g1~~TRINITY_DN2386_c0_g1_i1.p1  ORF type:complete len:184 (+),score=13.92 TRINITY_DN2386_c0_g1_i1:104-655(+)